MTAGRARGLALSLLTSALVLTWVGSTNAEVIVFVNGRTMAVKDYRVSGDTMTVALPGGGEATFSRAIVKRIAPDEVADPAPAVASTQDPASVGLPAPRVFESRPFAALIERVALDHGVDPALVHAVVQAESNYEPRATSAAGARGLMQVMPSTARDLGLPSARMLFDPQANLEVGVKYLKLLIGRFGGDLTSALAAYNAGPGAVLEHDGVPPFAETQNYVRRVLSKFEP